MDERLISRLLVVIFLYLFFFPDPGAAQRSFGVQYSPQGNTDQIQDDLENLQGTGVHNLMVNEIPDRHQMEIIQSAGFNVYVAIPVKFPTIWTLEHNRDDLINQWGRYVDFFRHYSSVKGISLFSFGQIHSERFRSFFRLLTHEIDKITDIPVFYVSSDVEAYEFAELFNYRFYQLSDVSDLDRLTSFEHIGGFIYKPERMGFDIREFQSLLEQTRDLDDIPIFFDWDWFIHNQMESSEMDTVIYAYANDPNALFPNPRTRTDDAEPNWLILILLVIWGSFVGHYSFMPTYRKSLFRFFDNHKFFIKDVMARHIRTGRSSMVILIQQGLLGGLFLLAMTKYTLSPLGYEAFIYHSVLSGLYTPGYLIIFLAGFLFFFLMNAIFTAWLYLMNSGIQNMGQAAIFHLWGQHLNLFIITLLITLILADRSIIAINIVALLFITVSLGSFIFAVVDAGTFTFTRYYYYPLTIFIYSLILAGLGVWLYFFTGAVEIWDLATAL